MRVAFQGEPGAHSEEAVFRVFGEHVEPVPCRDLVETFEATVSGRAETAVVPVENSQAGSINETYDLLLKHDLVIVGEYDLRVHQNLLALPGRSLDEIRQAYSHPQALAQCDAFLRHHRIEPLVYGDTAGSAKMLAEERPPGAAAIASRRAAQLYGLAVLAEAIETNPNNYTRFLALDRSPAPRTDRSKTSIVFVVENRPGTLYLALGALATRGINLAKIESRPGRERPWDYVFYVDVDGHADDDAMRAALDELGRHTSFLRVLGSYPKASPPAVA
ncbi:MAG TPA: prephenate dehydratase [bacterium]|nr:prephenate dehydratase [bacterium]